MLWNIRKDISDEMDTKLACYEIYLIGDNVVIKTNYFS